MKKNSKYIGMLALLPLFLVVLTPHLVEDANAQKAEGDPGTVSPKSYGSNTKAIVCGASLCSDLQGNSIQDVNVDEIIENPQ